MWSPALYIPVAVVCVRCVEPAAGEASSCADRTGTPLLLTIKALQFFLYEEVKRWCLTPVVTV